MKDIVTKEEFVKAIVNKNSNQKEEVEGIVNQVIEELFDYFMSLKSIDFGNGRGILRSKISKNGLDVNSPRTPRKEHIVITMKLKIPEDVMVNE